MALKDFKEYLATVQQQYVELKMDIADFEQAFKEGFITEDRLDKVKDELARVEVNYQRLVYVEFLLDMPSRRQKKYLNRKKTKELLAQFKDQNADAESVEEENEQLAKAIHGELETLTKK